MDYFEKVSEVFVSTK